MEIYPQIVAPVSRLFPASSPAAVFRAVAKTVVDAFERCTVRARPHVIEEGAKSFAPTFAYSYAPAAVIGVCPVLDVVASLTHIAPSLKLRPGSATILRRSKSVSYMVSRLSFKASTAFCVSARQGNLPNNRDLATVTSTFPLAKCPPVAFTTFGFAHYDKLPKS